MVTVTEAFWFGVYPKGKNIQIKLLVPRAILSETVLVSSVFTAGLSE